MLRLPPRSNFYHLWAFIVILALGSGYILVHASSSRAHDFIRVVHDNGVWWFQDGAGRRFFSLGVNCVGGCYGHAEDTPIPPPRKQRLIAWLKEWGFNTAGSWSSPSVWDELYVADQIYPKFFETQDDIFDDAFWTDGLADHLQREVQPFLGERNFLGYFLDNEREWNASDVFAFYAHLPKDTPGSHALVSHVAPYYGGSLERLNGEWQTTYESFDDIPGNGPRPPYSHAMQRGILKAWRTEVAIAYYRRMVSIVRALDPHHLILGIRYRGIPDPDLFAALSPYFDVNSINDYNRYGHLRPVYAELYQASGKPLMVSEFPFSGFPQPGHKSDLFVDVYTQEQRGLGYHKYLRQAAQAPFMVGMHWFMWMDYSEQDRREDGYPYPPDQNVGLVSHDEGAVYEELTRLVARANAAVPALHQASRWEPPPTPALPRLELKQHKPTVDGDLTEWPQDLGVRPTHGQALVGDELAAHTYFLAWDGDALYVAGDIADAPLQHAAPERWWQTDFLAIELRSVELTEPHARAHAIFYLFPTGGGLDLRQPYAARQEAPRRLRPLAIELATRPKEGGYTIEARLPAAAMGELETTQRPATWHVSLTYQNVDEISQAHWQGIVTLE
jgi:agarase